MDASSKRASTPVEDSALNNTGFSIDSLQIGDSTRSLLSGLNDYEKESDDEPSFSEKKQSGKVTKHSHSDSCSGGVSDESYSSDYEESKTTVKKSKRKEKRDSSRSSTSGSSSSSSYSTNSSSTSATKTPKRNHSDDICSSDSYSVEESPLSPWEKWLLGKVVEDKKRAEIHRRNIEKEKEVKNKQMSEKSEKEKRVEASRKEWLKLKQNEEKIKNELAERVESEKVQKKLEEQARIDAKAKESFEKWFEQKEIERKAQIKNKKVSEKVKQESEMQRKQQNEEAYKLWLEKSKKHQKSKNNHFGYLGGKVTGYYDWTTYPMPSYNNPNPWVSPKVRGKYQSRVKLQNPSPPLLFKDLEQREKKEKQTQNKVGKLSRNCVF